jgi:hypothetical protein
MYSAPSSAATAMHAFTSPIIHIFPPGGGLHCRRPRNTLGVQPVLHSSPTSDGILHLQYAVNSCAFWIILI